MGRASQEFDRQLFTLKMAELSRQMQIESVRSDREAAGGSQGRGGSLRLLNIVEGQLALLGEWLEGVDRIAREVWQIQGKALTPDFVREILVPEAMMHIGARDGTIKSSLTDAAVRTHVEDPYPAQHHLAMEVNRLKAEVANRYEIEARELEYRNAPTALPSAEMAGNAQGAAPSQLENLKRGIAARNARIEQIERILSNPPSKIVQGVPVQVNLGSPSALRLIEEKQRHEMARDELLQELSRFQTPMKPAGGVSNAPKPFAGVSGSEWRDFHDRFMLLAREEQGLGQADLITNGKALRRMEVLRAHCDYKDYRERVFVAEEVRSFYESLGVELTSEDLSKIEAKMLEWTELEKKAGLKAPETGRWTYGTGAVSENFRERVRLCVVEAGRSLPDYPKGTDPEDFWLHQLYLDLLKNNSDLLFCGTKEGGMILSVCVASATFCARLERKAVTGEVCSRTNGNQAEPSRAQIGAKPGPAVASSQSETTKDRGGRPRKDDERRKVADLRSQGKTWTQVANQMNRETSQKKSKDAYRNLLRSRETLTASARVQNPARN
jgi:hypothetical protein